MNLRSVLVLLGLIASACATSAPAPASPPLPASSEDARFTALLDEEWEWGLRSLRSSPP